MKKRVVTSVLVSGMLISSVLAACSGKDTASPSASPASGGSTSPSPKGERSKVTMFFNNAGLAAPEGVDLSNNPYIKIVDDQANVDLKMESPPYTEYQTKFNLLLSSGNLPDILHTNYPGPTYQAARDGAFIDLKPYYDKSPTLQKLITPQMMELAKDPLSGKYWRIPMAYDKGPQGSGVLAKVSLINQYNDGKWPDSIDQWVDLLRKIKKAEPDSIPMSNRVVGDYMFAYGGSVFFKLYGAYPYDYRIQDGKVIPNVVLPEYKAAVELYRQLYSEGIFDKEFATTDGTKWFEKVKTKNVLFQWNSADQLLPGTESLFAPNLKVYPSVLKDPKYTYAFQGLPINDHGLYISAKSKSPDLDFKVIEAFASDKLRESIFWGTEGDTYSVANGNRIPDPDKLADPNRKWVKSLAFLFGYTDGQDAQLAISKLKMGTDKYKLATDSMKVLADNAKEVGLNAIIGYVESDDITKKNSEIMQDINRFTAQAIMGKITMDQFDQEVKNWEKKYRSLKYDPLQKYIDANKQMLSNLGVKMVNW